MMGSGAGTWRTRYAALVAVALGLPLAGCATADAVNLANGQPAYSIGCDLGSNGLSQCYAKAGEMCGTRGYGLRDWQGHALSFNAAERNLEDSFSSFAAKTILAQCNP